VQLSSANQHHCNKPSNTISPQDGAAVENKDSDVNASSGIQEWESDSTAATKQQLYLVKNMHASWMGGEYTGQHQDAHSTLAAVRGYFSGND
jgi:hypothetical protein